VYYTRKKGRKNAIAIVVLAFVRNATRAPARGYDSGHVQRAYTHTRAHVGRVSICTCALVAVRRMCNLSALRCVEDRGSLRVGEILTPLPLHPSYPSFPRLCALIKKMQSLSFSLLPPFLSGAGNITRAVLAHRGARASPPRERFVFLTRHAGLRDLSRVPAYLLSLGNGPSNGMNLHRRIAGLRSLPPANRA